MIKHVWSVLCESSSVDLETNQLSLFDVLHGVSIQKTEGEEINLPLKFEVVSLWETEGEDAQDSLKIKVSILYPDDEVKEIFSQDMEVKNSLFHRTRIRFQGISLKASGRHAILIEGKEDGKKKWQKLSELPIFVNFLKS